MSYDARSWWLINPIIMAVSKKSSIMRQDSCNGLQCKSKCHCQCQAAVTRAGDLINDTASSKLFADWKHWYIDNKIDIHRLLPSFVLLAAATTVF